MTSRLFPALLRYWRNRRGLSQLDLALEANVSARHVSFLESGRAKPSDEMALRLLAVLSVPLREQNHALRAAGLSPHYPEPEIGSLDPVIEQAIERMMAQQEPYPLTVLSADSTILRSNAAAARLFGAFVAEPSALPTRLDLFTLIFDPRFMRPFVVDWPALARSMVSRLHREHLARGGDERLAARLEQVFAYPDVPRAWRNPDFAVDIAPCLTLRFARGDLHLGFLTTLTVFSAPQQVTLEELRIESCFPLDEATRQVCEAAAKDA
jgi:transcriptional regulator with XRE-family HTH domain